MIRDQFIKTIKEYELLAPGDRVLIAVSGGVDSTALLNLLHSIKEEFDLDLHVAHLNHMLRRGDAELDLKFVQELSSRLGIPVTAEACDVQAMANQEKKGLEAAARVARYNFFERVAKQIGADKIAVGHTADDNVETFLMRMLRGAGLKGLCGITPKRGKIIRPMIKNWRKEIEEYVGSIKLVPRRDYTNYESKYLRNRVRMKLVPQLRLYNLNIKEIILQTILLLTEDSDYLEKKADEYLKEMIVSTDENELKLELLKLKGLEGAIQGRVVRCAIEKIKGDLIDVSFVHIKDIGDKLNDTESWELHLPGGIFASGSQGVLTISGEKPVLSGGGSFCYLLTIPGSVNICELGKQINAEIVKDTDLSNSKNMIYVDYAVLGKKITIRNRSDGDKFNPLGMTGTKKVQDLFVDNKIPADQRDLVPILESGGKIIWIAGLQMDERAKVTPKTKEIVKLEIK
ncbi:MAG: tRNA lysidine(34) synthetase TilS [Candidatus Margulisiibacteriota bacterium]|nr:tRNA lysidine(34) synthetase TilS [Candidatus Margulisiibacteriota bacterium]